MSLGVRIRLSSLAALAAALAAPGHVWAQASGAPISLAPPPAASTAGPVSPAPPPAIPTPRANAPANAVPMIAAPAPAAPVTAGPLAPAPPKPAATAAAPPRMPKSTMAPPLIPTEKMAASSGRSPAFNAPHTLAEALAATYLTQPALQAERAKLRATDENVPTALSGWRPQIQMSGTTGYGDGASRSWSFQVNRNLKSRTERFIATAAAQASQTIYNGGKTPASVNRAKNQVMGERASLLAQEQTSLLAAVNAYVGVIAAQQNLGLNKNNMIVLAKQLQATNDRFKVGEITRTDVAQAEAALAGAQAQVEVSEGQLETARGTFEQVIGSLPPPGLVAPQPIALPLKSEAEAISLAISNNPQVIAAKFNVAAAKDAIDLAFSALLPQITVQGTAFQQNNAAAWATALNGYQITANLTVPLYQGGSEYSAVRQARQTTQQTEKQLEDAKRTAVQAAVQTWETLIAARAAADSTRAQIRANEIALEGVEREAIVGSRTTLDVLNAQQTLLQSRTNLVQALAQLVNASYGVAAAIGRLTARDMHLPVPLYDETAYYDAVRDKWVGLGDYARNQPGR